MSAAGGTPVGQGIGGGWQPGGRPARGSRPATWARDLSLALGSGGLLVLCFPKFDLWPLAWVALVPLFCALEGRGPGRAFLLGHAAGVAFFTGIFWWIGTLRAWNLLDDLVVKGLYLPLYLSGWAAAVAWVRCRTGVPAFVVAPPLWVASEYLRGHVGFFSLPWMFLGHSQYAVPPVMQVAAWTGAYGLSFLLVLANAALAGALLHWLPRCGARADRDPLAVGAASPVVGLAAPVTGLAAAAVLAAGTLAYGAVVLARDAEGPRASVALVQGNIPPARRWAEPDRRAVLDRYAALTRAAARQGARLILWPEGAVPGDVEHEPRLRERVAGLAAETGSYLLVGGSELAKFTAPALRGQFYNALVLFSPRGSLAGVYRKMVLVPFGEYVPLRGVVAWPRALVRAMGDLLPGTEPTAFVAGPVSFRAVICWEIIFPDFVRDVVRGGAGFLVLATNEAWFGDTAAPYQLLAMTAVRAVENRIAIARVANTGVSALIDPFGRIAHRLRGADGRELFVDGVLVGQVPLGAASTVYTRYGDVFAYLQVAAALAMVLVAAQPRRAWRGDG